MISESILRQVQEVYVDEDDGRGNFEKHRFHTF